MNTSAVARSPSLPIQPQAQSSCLSERVKRLALDMLSLISVIGGILISAHVITGIISPWYAVAALAFGVVQRYCLAKARQIHNYNDPNEVQNMQYSLMQMNMEQILRAHSLSAIFQYDLMGLQLLRLKCCLSLACGDYLPLTPIITPTVFQHADELLNRRIITPEIHRALVARDYGALSHLPRNRHEIYRMFHAFDAAQ